MIDRLRWQEKPGSDSVQIDLLPPDQRETITVEPLPNPRIAEVRGSAGNLICHVEVTDNGDGTVTLRRVDPEESEGEAMAEEPRKLNRAVTDAFGMPASYRFTVQPTGIQFVNAIGRITWFGSHGWTTEQEEAVKGLYKHFPCRAVTSIPDDPHFTWEHP